VKEMKRIFLLIYILLLAAGCNDRTDIPVNWKLYVNNPVFTSRPGSWDEGTVSAPMVVMFKDTLRMWFEGSSTYGFDSSMHIGYAWSTDGINWTQSRDKPVLYAQDEDQHLVLPKVIVDGDTLRMWFGGGNVLVPGQVNIRYAVSTDGINWNRYPEPVIKPTKPWCKDGVLPGGVIKENGVYKMWFSGGIGHYGYPTTALKWSVGLATSPDGIHWTLSDEPLLRHGSGSDFDLNAANCATVIKSGSGYEMWYCGWRSGTAAAPPSGKIGYAASVDGIEWEKYERNPVLRADSATSSFGNAFLEPCVLFDGKQYRMWFAAWHGADPSIGYATSGN
jgi:beta-1,2-mannobiose phosphorylase / 1,2-beta-oligomannan phosphorylase